MRTARLVLAAVVAVSLAGCVVDGEPAPPTVTTEPTAAREATFEGYRPDDPAAAIAAGLRSVTEAETGAVVETRVLTMDGDVITSTIESSFRRDDGTARADLAVRSRDVDLDIGLATTDETVLIQGPTAWGMPEETWYRFDDGRNVPAAVLSPDYQPSHVVTALETAALPGWVVEGDATTDSVTYEVTVSERACARLFTRAVADALASLDYTLDGVVPARVTVTREGSLERVVLNLSALAMRAFAIQLPSFDPSTRLEYLVTLEVTQLGDPVQISLPDVEEALPASRAPDLLLKMLPA